MQKWKTDIQEKQGDVSGRKRKKRKEMHIKVQSEENSGVQCLGITVFTSNLPKGKQQ